MTEDAYVYKFFNNRSRKDCLGDEDCVRATLSNFSSAPVISRFICGNNQTSACVSNKLFQPYNHNAFVGAGQMMSLTT